jgi:hypothetical protein
MTAHPVHPAPDGGHPAMDYAEHEATYKLFLNILKYAVVAIVAVLAVMALTLT